MTLKGAVNTTMVRIENEKKLTALLYREKAMTKQELASELRMSLPTVNKLVQNLEDKGYIYYQSSEQFSGGRIPSLVCFNYDSYVTVGLGLSRHHIRIVLIDFAGNVKDSVRERCQFEPEDAYWKRVNQRISALLDKNGIGREKVVGVGIALPGPVQQTEKVLSSWLLGLEHYSYRMLEELFECPVLVENDANAAGYAESILREDLQDAAYLSVSSGVGGAIIKDGKVFRGQNNCTGEFGHLIVQPHGRKCLCGRSGCLDMYCSTNILAQYCEDNLTEFFERKRDDAALQKVWDEYLDYLAIGISNISMVLDIPVIVGGELAPFIHQNFSELQDRIDKLDPFNRTVILGGLNTMGQNVSPIGAALMLAMEHLNIL